MTADRCPECGGHGARGCGARWHDGRPDDDIYPGFGCWDKMQSGSVNIGGTRLPVWAVIGELISNGWDGVAYGYEPACTADDLNGFLYNLLEARGEFGRLLLALANAERLEGERRNAVLDEATGGEGGLVNVSPWDPDAVQLPPAWWEDPELAKPVAEQLRRCLAVLETTGA